MKQTTGKKGSKGNYPGLVAWITLKNGKKIYAKDYGYKGFPIGGKSK